MERKTIAKNKRAYHDYFIIDTLECGIVLKGTEIKSIRQHKVSIQEAYCQIKDNRLTIYNMHISPYDHGNIFNHQEIRDRILLAHKQQIRKLSQTVALQGLTIIPLEVYIEQGLAKVLIALCKGKKNYDKREDLRQETVKKDIAKVKNKRW